MATYSSILAWKFPRTEEPGTWGQQSQTRLRTKQQSCVRQLLLCPPQGMFLKQSMIYSGELYSQMEAVEQICPWFYLAQHILILFALSCRPES